MWIALFDRVVTDLVAQGSLVLTLPDGSTHTYGNGQAPRVAMRIGDPALLRRLVLQPDLALGEGYMDGTITIEGDDLHGMFALLMANVAHRPKNWRNRLIGLKSLFRHVAQFNPMPRARANVAHHYDLSGELYDLFLDEDRQYSCAYFRSPDMTLEEAQRAKKDHIARKLLLEPGMTVLDIGCGWGGLALTLARDYGAKVLGVTLSVEQHKIACERAARAGLSDRVEFRLADYRTVTGTFDRIVSVGMFEHVGIPHYGEYFRNVHDRLAPDGVALIHYIGRIDAPSATSPWITKYIFPGGYCPALSEVMPAIQNQVLYTTDIEVWRLHYAETLRHWQDRFMANIDKARALYDDRFCRMWRYYLVASEQTFRYYNQCVFQIQLAHRQEAVPLTRDYLYAPMAQNAARAAEWGARGGCRCSRARRGPLALRRSGMRHILPLMLCAWLAGSAAGADTAGAALPDLGAAGASLAGLQPVTAPHVMVVTAQHLATQIGVDILRQGGNAVDAAVAVGYALAVVHPCCGNIGGGGFMVLHLADGTDRFLDFRETAPLAATPGMFLDASGNADPDLSRKSWTASGVPGTVKGLDAALSRYGTMPRATVMAPAIRLAREGFVLTEADAQILALRTKDFAGQPNVAPIFLRPDGQPLAAGDRLVQPGLAMTLEAIAKDGPDAFYKGPIAQALVAASQANGGLFTLQDLASYTAPWSDPVSCAYRGVQVLSSPPPSSGGTTICEILQILQAYPLASWGYGAAATTHAIVEAERRAFADRNTYLGDPAFVTNPVARLLSSDHAEALRAGIDPDRATPSDQISGSLGPEEGQHTTHYSIVDAKGDAVAVTYTINFFFGNAKMAGDTGFFLNNEMDDFTAKPGAANAFGLVQGAANAIAPGKRPLSSMAPTIVLKNGQLMMVTGSPGGSTIISTVLESILNVVDFGMNLQQAVDAPRVHHQWLPDKVTVEPGYLTPQTRAALEAMGHVIEERPAWGADEAILRDPASGLLQGANDGRRPAGLAQGY
ncbi:gamma-glutamyltransferase [bacterium]|nr:gamma-glutamyltransferase [bacterium]